VTGKYKGPAAVTIDARKGKIYSRIYEIDDNGPRPVSGHLLLSVNEISREMGEDTLFIGDAVNACRETLMRVSAVPWDTYEDWFPRASNLGKIGIRMALGGTDDPLALEPLYLHAKECNINQVK
jgi:tRNA A37 threonylcarbamoyladenosine modification protein TsaB